MTGKSVTAIVHMLNQAPVDWDCKLQATVKAATYGAEFNAARRASEQIDDLQYTLMSMGVPIERPSWMLGDNQSVITSSSIPHSLLKKRHIALSYHKVHAGVAHGHYCCCHVDSKNNISDPLSKALGYSQAARSCANYSSRKERPIAPNGTNQESRLVTLLRIL